MMREYFPKGYWEQNELSQIPVVAGHGMCQRECGGTCLECGGRSEG